jgi:hypothetical protein
VYRIKAIAYALIAASCFLGAARLLTAQGEVPPAIPTPSSTSVATLDYEFFKDNVEPIFLKKRPGHARCVTCHSVNNVRLHVVPLSPGAPIWNEEQSRQNFELVKRVAFPGNPMSPLLVHPLAEDAGGDFFHSGGKHFNSQNDREWLTLKAFVLGDPAKRGQ